VAVQRTDDLVQLHASTELGTLDKLPAFMLEEPVNLVDAGSFQAGESSRAQVKLGDAHGFAGTSERHYLIEVRGYF
jgi:hypothetical protein